MLHYLLYSLPDWTGLLMEPANEVPAEGTYEAGKMSTELASIPACQVSAPHSATLCVEPEAACLV